MMKATEVKLEYKLCENSGCAIPVIIVAAGNSSRMQGINKQFLMLCGKPLLVRTIKKFEDSPYISRIIVVTREEDINAVQRLSEEYSLSKVTDIVRGGADRQTSVVCGINRLSGDEERVLIHDGARPFVNEEMIENCVEALYRNDAVLCALKIVDTVKLADEEGTVTGTLDRSKLYLAQTPQGVRVSLYKNALQVAEDTSKFTDDASVMENAGYTVRVIDGDRCNIKITTPKDIELAEMFIKGGM